MINWNQFSLLLWVLLFLNSLMLPLVFAHIYIILRLFKTLRILGMSIRFFAPTGSSEAAMQALREAYKFGEDLIIRRMQSYALEDFEATECEEFQACVEDPNLYMKVSLFGAVRFKRSRKEVVATFKNFPAPITNDLRKLLYTRLIVFNEKPFTR